MYRTSGREGPSPQRHKPTRNAKGSHPHAPNPPRPFGVTNVGSTTAIDTHNIAGTIVPKRVEPPLTPSVYQGPTPTPRGDAHTQHTEPGPSCCVPFGDPHVHQVTPSGETRQGAATAAQRHWGQFTIWGGHTRPTTNPKEGKRRGYISKELCANADLCPLASPRVALVGVCLLRHPDNGNTR